ncbi:hypothetical protein MMC28_008143 [Mycoblastus sanguinarius]|nr:hypothetical protein [Mycoblastus sanguinarius]
MSESHPTEILAQPYPQSSQNSGQGFPQSYPFQSGPQAPIANIAQCPFPSDNTPQSYHHQSASQAPTTNALQAPNYTDDFLIVPIDEADKQPWRHRGYRELCKWTASDDDFFVLRRFGELSARVLLRMQDRIVQLEEELRQEDISNMKSANHNGTFRYDISCQRHNILEELTWRLEKYQRFVLDHTQMKASPEATQFQISNVKRWLSNANDNAIHEDEVGFLSREGDLIPVVPQVKTPLRRFIDKFNKIRLLPFFRDKKVNQYLHGDSEDFGLQTSVYGRESVVDKFVTCTTMLLGLAMLIGPFGGCSICPLLIPICRAVFGS